MIAKNLFVIANVKHAWLWTLRLQNTHSIITSHNQNL